MQISCNNPVDCSGNRGPAAHRTGLPRQQAAEDRLRPGPGDDDYNDDDDDLVQDGAEKELLKEIELISGVQVTENLQCMQLGLC